MADYYYPKMTKEKEENLIRYLEKIARREDTVPEDIEMDYKNYKECMLFDSTNTCWNIAEKCNKFNRADLFLKQYPDAPFNEKGIPLAFPCTVERLVCNGGADWKPNWNNETCNRCAARYWLTKICDEDCIVNKDKRVERAEKLFADLEKFAIEYNAIFQYQKYDAYKYAIFYPPFAKNIVYIRYIGADLYSDIWFDNKAVARLAMELFRDELIWYFTEYKKKK